MKMRRLQFETTASIRIRRKEIWGTQIDICCKSAARAYFCVFWVFWCKSHCDVCFSKYAAGELQPLLQPNICRAWPAAAPPLQTLTQDFSIFSVGSEPGRRKGRVRSDGLKRRFGIRRGSSVRTAWKNKSVVSSHSPPSATEPGCNICLLWIPALLIQWWAHDLMVAHYLQLS